MADYGFLFTLFSKRDNNTV